RQPYLGLVRHRADRALRKRIPEGTFRHEPEVQVITLRKAAAADSAHVPEDDHVPFDYSCSWVVRGHWRRQPCGPGRAETRDVYITPYVKGNLEKPLKLRSDVVYAVRR